MSKPMFISFEGIDGSGKSTHVRNFCQYLDTLGKQYVTAREPGGTPLGEDIRNFALKQHADKCATAELYLFEASRAELFQKVLLPAIQSGKMVVMDRFCDSTLAYQGYGNQNDLEAVRYVDDFATNGTKPDLTFYLDIDPYVAFARRTGRAVSDVIEDRGIQYQQRVRDGYLEILHANPDRIVYINADDDIDKVDKAIIDAYLQRIKND